MKEKEKATRNREEKESIGEAKVGKSNQRASEIVIEE